MDSMVEKPVKNHRATGFKEIKFKTPSFLCTGIQGVVSYECSFLIRDN